MPAGFNKGQVEYIKTIANVNGHKTYKPVRWPLLNSTIYDNALTKTQDLYTKWRMFCLDRSPQVRKPSATPSDPNELGVYGDTVIVPLDAFNVPIAANSDGVVNETQREGTEGFLESTHLRLRCVLKHATDGGFEADHGEYRIIVFRARDRQHPEIEHMQDENNPLYNLFRGMNNYNIGFDGYELKENQQGTIKYSDDSSDGNYDVTWASSTGCFNLPVNKEAWIVMKDHRFFLGREYGGKNIYETTLHWNWNDPVATASPHVSDTTNDKNYNWYILIMGTNNNANTTNVASLSVKITGTTHMTSG